MTGKEKNPFGSRDDLAKITVTKNGPYIVTGGVPLVTSEICNDEEGYCRTWREVKRYPLQEKYALCRCGQSKNKPFCDGTHSNINFDGTEAEDRQPFDEAAVAIRGPALTLADNEHLCVHARFCMRAGGIWNLVEQTDNPEARRLVEYEAGHCPAGRLVAWDRETGKPIEPKFEPSLGLIEDTEKKVSGPIWVRGGIPVVSADGKTYEIRNRVTLCRCGRSDNKPFCNGSHAA